MSFDLYPAGVYGVRVEDFFPKELVTQINDALGYWRVK